MKKPSPNSNFETLERHFSQVFYFRHCLTVRPAKKICLNGKFYVNFYSKKKILIQPKVFYFFLTRNSIPNQAPGPRSWTGPMYWIIPTSRSSNFCPQLGLAGRHQTESPTEATRARYRCGSKTTA